MLGKRDRLGILVKTGGKGEKRGKRENNKHKVYINLYVFINRKVIEITMEMVVDRLL